MAGALGGPVRVAPYAAYGTAELAANMLRALTDRTACLLQQPRHDHLRHTLDRAYDRTAQLEWMCRLWLTASSVPGPDPGPADAGAGGGGGGAAAGVRAAGLRPGRRGGGGRAAPWTGGRPSPGDPPSHWPVLLAPDTGPVRTVKATVAAVIGAVLAAGAASVAVGRLASGAALKAPPGRPAAHRTPAHRARHGGRPDHPHPRPRLPAAPASTASRATAPTRSSARSSARRRAAADTVVRRLERVTHGTFSPATPSGSPRTSTSATRRRPRPRPRRRRHPGRTRPLPAWFVPGARDTWVIAVHGLGTTREQALNVMGFLTRPALPGARPRLPRRPRRAPLRPTA